MAAKTLPLDKSSSFATLGLDTRVLDAIARLAIRTPTEVTYPVSEQCADLVLAGRCRPSPSSSPSPGRISS